MPDNVDVTRDARAMGQLPIDDKVTLPKQVREAKERTDAYYAQQKQASEPQPSPPLPEPVQANAPEPQPEPAPQPEPQPMPEGKPPPEDMREVEYARRYNMMRGRYEEEQRRLAALDAQNAALRSELLRVQNRPPEQAAPPPKLITPEDEANYGRDLIDFTMRAAKEVVGPQLSALEAENERLRQMVAEQSRGSMTAALDASVPNWRQIFADPRFTQWLNLPDVYSGRLRSQLLTEAADAGNSRRVVAFYQGFLADAVATGQIDSGSPPSPRTPARKAAIALEAVATPGRGHPAGGTPSRAGNEKPLITRDQIKEFYSDVRKNRYVGREQQKMAEEAVIGAALRDGRVIP